MVVLAALGCAVPAFSEAWITLCANRKGLSVLSATRDRDRLIQVKNAVVDVPELGKVFRIGRQFW